MTLSDFIETDIEGLIDDWTAYARAISPGDNRLDDTQLRNSARELLLGIAADMRGAQTDAQQEAKSHGERPNPDSAFNLVGRGHADDRREQGFEINALVAEYRALRASVLRRWQRTCQTDQTTFQEMIRFNEAVDQMVAASVQQFADRSARIRDLFAGVLAHDMRSPLGAVLNSAHVVLQDENLSPVSVRAIANLQRSAGRLKALIDDLFVFTRARLGDTLPVEPTQQDFGNICRGAVDEVRAARPGAQIDVQSTGNLVGTWDAARMNQLIVNLVTNAIQHGSGMVRLEASADDGEIVLSVSNEGSIPKAALPTLFDPLTRATPSAEYRQASTGVGLGLFICRCIVRAHHGTIGVESNENSTVFTVTIPRFPILQR